MNRTTSSARSSTRSRITSVAAPAGLLLLLLGWGSPAAAADPLSGLSISKGCLERLQRRMLGGPGTRLVLGHLYYTRDAATAQSACGWDSSSQYRAFAACSREAHKRGIAAPCLLVVKDSVVVAGSYADAQRQAGADAWELTMASDRLRCGQEPGNRFFWLEYGFCDMNQHGPEKARGVVIWNHGRAGTMVQHTAPPALALRLLQARGWDVLKLNRHNLAEGEHSYHRAEERVLEEIKALRDRGYKKIVVGGQSFGGRVALEVGTVSHDIFATIAMAPGMESLSGNTRLQGPTDLRLQRAKTERIAVVFPGNDELFGHPDRGRTAGPILAKRGRPYLLLDEAAGLRGHGGGHGGNFALRYGRCLEAFLSAETVPEGRFSCPVAGSGWALVQELIPMPPANLKVLSAVDELPRGLADLGGRWYGILGESIVSWALVDAGGTGPSVLYTWASSGNSRGGAVYDATVEAGQVTVMLPSRAVLSVRPREGRRLEMTWTPAAAESNFALLARKVEPLTGELVPGAD